MGDHLTALWRFLTRAQFSWKQCLALIVLIGTAGGAAAWRYTAPERRQHAELAEAQAALASKEYYRAEALLSRLTEAQPEDAQLQLLRAQALRGLQRLEDAEVALGKAGELGLPKEEGYREFGLLFATKDFALAQGALEQVAKRDPKDTEVLHALAVGYAIRGRSLEAQAAFQRLLEAAPDDLEGRLDFARLYLEAEHFDKAADLYRSVLAAAPQHFRARILLANCLLADARAAEAEPELLVCREMRPDSPDPLIGLALCARERGDRTKTLTLLSRAFELDPGSFQALSELGNEYLAAGRYDLAELWFTKALKLDDKDKQAHLKIAQALRYLGKIEPAQEHERTYQQLAQEEAKRLDGRRPPRF